MILFIVEQIGLFFVWTLVLYVMHVMAHQIPFLWHYHKDHHVQVATGNVGVWRWTNLFLYIDTWETTVDQWLTEVIPTFIFCYITDSWWIFIGYWIWSATFQEIVEHNSKIDIYPLEVSGQWHLVHHKHDNKNYGIIHPLWDIIFNTHQNHLK